MQTYFAKAWGYDGGKVPRDDVEANSEAEAAARFVRLLDNSDYGAPPADGKVDVYTSPMGKVHMFPVAEIREWLDQHGDELDDDK
jgi:hypothetical protein